MHTGPLAGNWASQLVGFKSEIAALNATGRINGQKISLITEDDASVAANDLAAAQSLVQASVSLLWSFWQPALPAPCRT
jgi:ABC-type branched-subunit amino acid transport system substrate-binding protein